MTPGEHAGRETDLLSRAGDVLRGRGERMTAPRRAVLRALAAVPSAGGAPSHLSAEEVLARVAETAPRVHRASVYRALESLSRSGLVRHVHMGHGATAYHLAQGAGDHLHARCRGCGRVVDLPSDLLDEVASRLDATHGFALDASHVALSGTCAACRTAGELSPRAPR